MTHLTRREALGALTTAAVGAAAGGSTLSATGVNDLFNLRQSICRSCFEDVPIRTFLRQLKGLGATAVDLLPAEDWSTAKQYGLVCSTGYGGAGTITDGLSDPANHDGILRNLERTLPKAAAAGVPNIITFFGSRLGMSDAEGITNCVSALKRIAPIAEQQGVTVIAELLNSKIDHPDYIGDNTTFGVEVVRQVNSPQVKLLYDIYHMQVMEGNIIRTIQENHRHIAHYHTAGVPGRGELSRQQELNWPVIARTIAATGFSGFVAHEFSAANSSWEPVRKALNLFDVQRYSVNAEFRS